MDKRTFIFLFALTALFFLVNQWLNFGGITTPSKPTEPDTQVVVLETGEKPVPIPIDEQKALEIVPLYRDVELKDFFTLAFRNEDTFLAPAPTKKVPHQVYARNDSVRISSTELLTLRVSPKEAGDPILYSVYPFAKVDFPYIPKTGQYPLKMIFFEGNRAFKIEGKLLSIDEAEIPVKPPTTALVVLDYGSELLPFAFYNPKENKLTFISGLESFEDYSYVEFPVDKETEKEYAQQKHYVLENNYQQLVFSNLNGSLVEINLPFESKTNQKSVVREIEIDKVLQDDYPHNDWFPHVAYFVSDGKGGMIEKQPELGGYTPLLRRTLLGRGGQPSTRFTPHFYSFNVFEQNMLPDPTLFQLKRIEKNLIEFEHVGSKRRITKTFTIPDKSEEAPYVFMLDVRVDGDARGLHLATGIPEVELVSNAFVPTLKYRHETNGKMKVESIKPPKTETTYSHVVPDWICNGNGFFGVIIDPLNSDAQGLSVDYVSGELAPSRITLIDSEYDKFPASKYPGYNFTIPLPSKSGVTRYRVFAGPFDKQILTTVDDTFENVNTRQSPDYAAARSYHGFFAAISVPFARFLSVILDFFHAITGSWGFSIILLTIVLRLMLYPLNSWSFKSMAKMQLVTPKVEAIREKYKKDPKRVQLEIVNLYKTEKVNPAGGCFPMLIQLPFLFGMFNLLKSSFDLRGASFIPGWIDNLTAPDVLFSWSYPIPFIGTSLHLLPLILGAIMYFQQKIATGAKKGVELTDQQKQQKMMGIVTPILFTFLFYRFPSGLNIYWISSTLLGILQQWYIKQKIASKPQLPPPPNKK